MSGPDMPDRDDTLRHVKIGLPVNGRPERLHLYEWMIGEERYVEGKFTDERATHDKTLEYGDIDAFWVRQVTQYYDRARLFLKDAFALRMVPDPREQEKAVKLEALALQAVAKAMMTAKGFAESMIRVYGSMPAPGVSSGYIEPWPHIYEEGPG